MTASVLKQDLNACKVKKKVLFYYDENKCVFCHSKIAAFFLASRRNHKSKAGSQFRT